MSNAMSLDRVKFYLASRYFQAHHTDNGMHREVCKKILTKAFGYPTGKRCASSWTQVMDRGPGGFYIVCRPSQFARFIVYRNEDGNCINGIRDLEPGLFLPKPKKDVYTRLAEMVENRVDRHTVKRITDILGHTENSLERALRAGECHEDEDVVIEVSKNPAY